MNPASYAGSLAVVATTMALAAGLEAVVPLVAGMRADRRRRRTNLQLTVMVLGLNVALGVATAAIIDPLLGASPAWLAGVGLPGPAEAAIGILALDFAFGYFAHRALHVVALLWRVHRVHHSDPFIDVTSTYRSHPIQSLWRHFCLIAMVRMLGVAAPVVAAYRLLSAVNGIFEHANIRLPGRLDRWLSAVWVTPDFHKVHHSRDRHETDTNYGNLFTLHDRLLATATPSERAATVVYGLEGVSQAEMASVTRLLAMPCGRRHRSAHKGSRSCNRR